MAEHLADVEVLPSPAASDEGEEGSDGGVFFVKLSFKGGTYEVPVETGDAISSIFDFVLEVPEMYDFPRDHCKLICKGKVFRPDDIVRSNGDFKLAAGSKLMLMATSNADAAFVRNNRADPLVKGFKEEERDEKSRQKKARTAAISAWGTKQDPKYRFNSIKAEFKYSTPSPYDAEKLLQKLATDPGIIELMKTRQFEVGILTEMSPAESEKRMKNMGKEGMDLLGYNQNAGEMIVLKLRTDNTKGFRPYADLINTLVHEMTHNVWGPHDGKFWKLFGELKAQYMKFHRFWSHGGQAADSSSSGQFQGFAGEEEAEGAGNFGQVLGGSSSAAAEPPKTEKERRERATLAAEARKVTETTGFNFLKSGGKVILVCPCGQVHDQGECPMKFPSVDDVEDEDDDMEVEPAASSASASASAADPIAAEPADAATDVEIAAEPAEAAADVAMVVEPAEAEAAVDVEMVAPPVHGYVETSSGELLPASSLAEAAMPQQEFEQGAAPTDVGPLAGLTAEDLEAMGLGGIADWLQSFTDKLKALTSHAAQSTARQAMELLLKLVRNIVNSPQEAKFRRIKADNPKIRSGLLAAGPEIEKLITLLGFEDAVEDGGRIFLLRDATFDSARLQMGQDLLQRQLGTVVSH